MIFKVKKEKTVYLITYLCIVILAIVLILFVSLATKMGKEDIYITGGAMAIATSVSLYFYLKSPQNIEITDKALILHKVRGKIAMPFNEIQEIRPYSKSGIRLCGSGGMFGYIGLFTNKEIGRHHEYVGDFFEAFLVVMKSGKKYVMSCENRDEAVKLVAENITEHNNTSIRE